MNYQIGTTQAGMASLESLGLYPPSKATPVDYAEYLTLGNGDVRGSGCLQCSWRFTYITLEQIAVLKALCPNNSVSIYIQTLAKCGAYKVYSGLMIMTETEQPKGDMLLDYVIKFRNLVEVV